MSTTGWITLIALFLGLHVLMRRGHVGHRRPVGGTAPDEHGHSSPGEAATVAARDESSPQRHSRC